MKKLLAILLVVATLFCIAACGDDNTDTTTTATQGSTTTTTTKQVDTTTTTVDGSDETTTTEPETTTTTEPETTVTTTKKPEQTTIYQAKPINGVDPTNPANQGKVVNNVYTSAGGGMQLSVPGWATYNLYSISMVPNGYTGLHSTNAICVAVYPVGHESYDSPDVFENKTVSDFETVMGTGIKSFQKTTLKGYTCYKAITVDTSNSADENGNPRPFYHVWVFQTAKAKYFISFMQASNDPAKLSEFNWTNGDMAPIANQIMNTIEIFD